MSDTELGRRGFLARMGVLGAVAAGGLFTGSASAATRSAGLEDLVAALQPVLAELARDTLNGLVVMTCPGPDEYSKAQGTPRPEPGAIEARATDFMIESLDNFVPFPDQLANPLGEALAAGLDGTGLDDALKSLLRNDETLPLSSVIAMLLNLIATQVNPAAVNGAFLSPFARLSYEDKCAVFEQMEGPNADLVATLDANLDEPLKESVSGMLRFVAGALLEFSAYGSYGEWGVYNPELKRTLKRPVGWELSGYQPDGVVHGWDDFLGYYQDRKQVDA
ncbi:MAG: hypothetical protein GEU86_13830 [Actinophytocola sp.]|nr:hypothetical protein [Actinophytocola sp.]